MHLKNLTVLGFKSFADKTSLNFEPGITAIVGPNGCGKSNVADAIRWVLGEQSPKALRGGEMADIIFNGTDSRKALGMSEVSLTITDVDEEHLKAAGVDISYNEVTLTRRVFRDGGSEYFINKVPCRLKDIQQLFMGTGVGRTSYSIMAQGNITQILSSRPDDRRLVFEEAAGITKFKSQKREALRKLDHTEQNLLRVEDLIREVKRQIGSLQRQAGKARRYKQFQSELEHLETQLARHQFDLSQAQIGEKNALAETLRCEMEGCSESVLRFEDEIMQLRERLGALEREISAAQQKGLEINALTERHEEKIQYNTERIKELEEQRTRAQHEIGESEERKISSEEELRLVTRRLEESQSAITEKRQLVERTSDALQSIESELQSNQESLRQVQSDAFGVAQNLTQARNEINALDLQKEGNLVRLEKLSSEKIQLEEERSGLDEKLQQFAASVEAEKQDAANRRGSVEDRQRRLVELQAELSEATQLLDSLLQEQAEQRSRLNVLEQLDSSHEGFSDGALAALKQSEAVLGSLSDKLQVPEQYVVAIEAALGRRLQIVLTEQPESAEKIIGALREGQQGKASIAALGLVNSLESDPTSEGTPPSPLPEDCVAALSVVRAEGAIQPLLKVMLDYTLIVPNLETATRQWRQTQGRFNFVTANGELLDRNGIFTGGSVGNGDQGAASILGRKNQIAELQAALSELQGKVDEASRRKGSLSSEQTGLQVSLQEAQSELKAKEVAIATHEGEVNALQNSHRALGQKIETVVYEVQSLADQDKEGTEKREQLAERVKSFEAREAVAQEQLNQLNASLEELRERRDQSQGALSESKVDLATEEQVCSSLERQKEPIALRLEELAQTIELRNHDLESIDSRKTQSESEIEESRRQMERLQHERQLNSEQTAAIVQQKSVQETEAQAREDSLREHRTQLTELQERRSAVDVEIAKKKMSVENLCERIEQKYHIQLQEIRSECITITYAAAGPSTIQVVTPEEMEQSGAGTDWDAVEQQVKTLQEKLDSMGPVNLVAIEEYEETEQRYHFLTTQYEDLVKAKEELLEVINRINVQTRQMFLETFEKIRENFGSLFTEIFGGGTCDLRLTDEGDVLESGIDIVARPPGKKLQSISLLSGGEQTMTAVSLLFAIYQVRPSPFCVLDELDAPLDESNINRFIKVLKRFLEHSQFVIITHNKRTIGTADILYGVTMEERGVSKIISVKFHKDSDQGADFRHRPVARKQESPKRDADVEHSSEEGSDGIKDRGSSDVTLAQ